MPEQNVSLILKKTQGYHLGEKVIREYGVTVLRTSEEKDQQTGSIVYLFPPSFPCPEPGDSLVEGETEHTVKAIQFCRDITGKLRGIKCTALN